MSHLSGRLLTQNLVVLLGIAALVAFLGTPELVAADGHGSFAPRASLIVEPAPEDDAPKKDDAPEQEDAARENGAEEAAEESPPEEKDKEEQIASPPEDERETDEESATPDGEKDAEHAPTEEGEKAESDESAASPESEEVELADTQAAEPDEEKDKSNSPQVEVYIPSVTDLVEAYRKSRSARLGEAFAGMLPKFEHETDDDFDFAAVLAILERIAAWPDTSIAMTTYTQDRDGRPRWAVRVDWPLADLRERVGELLDLEETKKLLKDISIRTQEDGSWVLELPDMVLAVVRPHGEGSMIAATEDLTPPELLFGQKALGEVRTPARGGPGTMLYCRLNMEAGDEGEKRRSMLSWFSFVSDIRYAASVDSRGQWRERIHVRWNPLVGLGVKTMLKKTSGAFDCPRECLAAGAIHLGISEGLADDLAGFDAGTIGTRAGGDMAFTVLPGEGFFPIPDIFYQLNVRRIDRIKKDIREHIEEDTDRRKDDDLPATWHEEEIDGKVVFWRDPSVDKRGSFSLATFRTVLFFEFADRDEDGAQDRLIIATTSMQAEDAVRRWRNLRRTPREWMRLPDSSRAHWQIVVNWKAAYELVQPYLSVFAATSEVGQSVPRTEALADSLSSSVADVRIELAGLDIRHTGPIPIGAVYVPGVTYASLSATADPGSEAARERMACRNLRVLHHHAKLFQTDYGRWPATVAELDGYVDFASHPHLLNIRPKDEGLLKGFVSMFTGDKRRQAREERDDDEIDDTLYEIEWDEVEWKLKFRENEFVNHLTIYIDHDGQIHRVPKPDAEIERNGDEQEDREANKDKKELALR